MVKMLQISGRPASPSLSFSGSVKAFLIFFSTDFGSSNKPNALFLDFAHLGLTVEAHDARRAGKPWLRFDKDLAEASIEAPTDLTGQFQVLHLIIANRHCVGLVQQNVGSHQNGVGENASVDIELVLFTSFP